MDVMKWVCFVLGAFLILVAVGGAPIGQPIAHSASTAAMQMAETMIKDGSITVNTDATLANHPPIGRETGVREHEARDMVTIELARAVSASVRRDTWTLGYCIFFVGVMCILAGVRIAVLSRRLRRAHTAATA